MKWYYGHKDHTIKVFKSDSTPTEETHGDKYNAVTGPFSSNRQCAASIADYTRSLNNPPKLVGMVLITDEKGARLRPFKVGDFIRSTLTRTPFMVERVGKVEYGQQWIPALEVRKANGTHDWLFVEDAELIAPVEWDSL